MVDNHNPDQTESKPLTTELEVLSHDATADNGLSSESTSTQQHETAHDTSAASEPTEGHVEIGRAHV